MRPRKKRKITPRPKRLEFKLGSKTKSSKSFRVCASYKKKPLVRRDNYSSVVEYHQNWYEEYGDSETKMIPLPTITIIGKDDKSVIRGLTIALERFEQKINALLKKYAYTRGDIHQLQ